MSVKERIRTIIFGTSTPAGKAFDVLLIVCIVASVLVVILDSVASIHLVYWEYIEFFEWFFTIVFTVEYILRVYSAFRRIKYIFSFFGIIDFISVLPTYIGIFFPSAAPFQVIKLLRILRVFRILKLASFIREVNDFMTVFRSCYRRICIFILTVLTIVTILGSVMYVIESSNAGFTSIPKSIYWAVVTLTTVGYGDISPNTALGQGIAVIIMILGYSLIVVPTGFISVAMSMELVNSRSKIICTNCKKNIYYTDAQYCKYCGQRL